MSDMLYAVAHAADLNPAALRRFLEEQIYTLPGTDRHREQFSILLTGSRATGMHEPESDVDLDIFCPRPVYEAVSEACRAAGIIEAKKSFFCVTRERCFGAHVGFPHFSLLPLDTLARDLRAYSDVPIWIWTQAKVITDPGEQFGRTLALFQGYPPEVLVRKLKYHWLRSEYAHIAIFPNHPRDSGDLLAALTGLADGINDLLRVFFLVEGRPFPYTEKLLRYADTTALGRRWGPFLQEAMETVVGLQEAEQSPWDRLNRVREMLICDEEDPTAKALWEDCERALIGAGVEPEWVAADFHNIDELLTGELGPAPQ